MIEMRLLLVDLLRKKDKEKLADLRELIEALEIDLSKRLVEMDALHRQSDTIEEEREEHAAVLVEVADICAEVLRGRGSARQGGENLDSTVHSIMRIIGAPHETKLDGFGARGHSSYREGE